VAKSYLMDLCETAFLEPTLGRALQRGTAGSVSRWMLVLLRETS
jgi:hypothetical protein